MFENDDDVQYGLHLCRATATLKFVTILWKVYHQNHLPTTCSLHIRFCSHHLVTQLCFIYKKRMESIQKQMVLFLLGDDKRHLFMVYADSCDQLGLTTLVRRSITATILFIHSVSMNRSGLLRGAVHKRRTYFFGDLDTSLPLVQIFQPCF